MTVPKPGDLLVVNGRASVQFAGPRALLMRVTSVCEKPTYHGWCWLTGYVLDKHGQAVAKREVFVQVDGLRRVIAPPARGALRRAGGGL